MELFNRRHLKEQDKKEFKRLKKQKNKDVKISGEVDSEHKKKNKKRKKSKHKDPQQDGAKVELKKKKKKSKKKKHKKHKESQPQEKKNSVKDRVDTLSENEVGAQPRPLVLTLFGRTPQALESLQNDKNESSGNVTQQGNSEALYGRGEKLLSQARNNKLESLNQQESSGASGYVDLPESDLLQKSQEPKVLQKKDSKPKEKGGKAKTKKHNKTESTTQEENAAVNKKQKKRTNSIQQDEENVDVYVPPKCQLKLGFLFNRIETNENEESKLSQEQSTKNDEAKETQQEHQEENIIVTSSLEFKTKKKNKKAKKKKSKESKQEKEENKSDGKKQENSNGTKKFTEKFQIEEIDVDEDNLSQDGNENHSENEANNKKSTTTQEEENAVVNKKQKKRTNSIQQDEENVDVYVPPKCQLKLGFLFNRIERNENEEPKLLEEQSKNDEAKDIQQEGNVIVTSSPEFKAKKKNKKAKKKKHKESKQEKEENKSDGKKQENSNDTNKFTEEFQIEEIGVDADNLSQDGVEVENHSENEASNKKSTTTQVEKNSIQQDEENVDVYVPPKCQLKLGFLFSRTNENEESKLLEEQSKKNDEAKEIQQKENVVVTSSPEFKTKKKNKKAKKKKNKEISSSVPEFHVNAQQSSSEATNEEKRRKGKKRKHSETESNQEEKLNDKTREESKSNDTSKTSQGSISNQNEANNPSPVELKKKKKEKKREPKIKKKKRKRKEVHQEEEENIEQSLAVGKTYNQNEDKSCQQPALKVKTKNKKAKKKKRKEPSSPVADSILKITESNQIVEEERRKAKKRKHSESDSKQESRNIKISESQVEKRKSPDAEVKEIEKSPDAEVKEIEKSPDADTEDEETATRESNEEVQATKSNEEMRENGNKNEEIVGDVGKKEESKQENIGNNPEKCQIDALVPNAAESIEDIAEFFEKEIHTMFLDMTEEPKQAVNDNNDEKEENKTNEETTSEVENHKEFHQEEENLEEGTTHEQQLEEEINEANKCNQNEDKPCQEPNSSVADSILKITESNQVVEEERRKTKKRKHSESEQNEENNNINSNNNNATKLLDQTAPSCTKKRCGSTTSPSHHNNIKEFNQIELSDDVVENTKEADEEVCKIFAESLLKTPTSPDRAVNEGRKSNKSESETQQQENRPTIDEENKKEENNKEENKKEENNKEENKKEENNKEEIHHSYNQYRDSRSERKRKRAEEKRKHKESDCIKVLVDAVKYFTISEKREENTRTAADSQGDEASVLQKANEALLQQEKEKMKKLEKRVKIENEKVRKIKRELEERYAEDSLLQTKGDEKQFNGENDRRETNQIRTENKEQAEDTLLRNGENIELDRNDGKTKDVVVTRPEIICEDTLQLTTGDEEGHKSQHLNFGKDDENLMSVDADVVEKLLQEENENVRKNEERKGNLLEITTIPETQLLEEGCEESGTNSVDIQIPCEIASEVQIPCDENASEVQIPYENASKIAPIEDELVDDLPQEENATLCDQATEEGVENTAASYNYLQLATVDPESLTSTGTSTPSAVSSLQHMKLQLNKVTELIGAFKYAEFRHPTTPTRHRSSYEDDELSCVSGWSTPTYNRDFARVYGDQTPQEQYKCIVCGRIFKSRKRLYYHSLNHEHDSSFCGTDTRSEISFVSTTGFESIADHTSVCSEANTAITNEKASPVHQEDGVKKKKKREMRYQCGTCLEKFSRRFEIEMHIFCVREKLIANHGAIERFKCVMCNATYGRLILLRRHLVQTHKVKIYPCTRCNEEFSTPDLRSNHIKQAHNNNNNNEAQEKDIEEWYQCGTCSEKFSHYDEWHDHLENVRFKKIAQHKPIEEYVCAKCGISTQKPYHLHRHIVDKHGAKTWFCTQCDERFGRRMELATHVTQVHNSFSKHVNDAINDQEPQSESDSSHEEEVVAKKEKEKEEIYQCEPQSESDSSHEEEVAKKEKEEEVYQCGNCLLKFADYSHVQEHIVKVRKNLIDGHDPISSFICAKRGCGKKYTRAYQLKNHMCRRLHTTSVKIEQCDTKVAAITQQLPIGEHKETTDKEVRICKEENESSPQPLSNKTTNQQDEVPREEKTHQESRIKEEVNSSEESEKICQCGECLEQFSQHSQLVQHARHVQQKLIKNHGKITKYQCITRGCTQTFNRSYPLKLHLIGGIHTTNYQCSKCELKFKDERFYAKHLEVEHIFECCMCERSYTSQHMWEKHNKTHEIKSSQDNEQTRKMSPSNTSCSTNNKETSPESTTARDEGFETNSDTTTR